MEKILSDTLWESEKMALAINPKQVTTSHGVVDCGDLSAYTSRKIIDEHKNNLHKKVKGRIQTDGTYVLNKKRDVDCWIINDKTDWIDEIIISTAETAMSYLNYNLVGLLERPQLLRYTSPSRGYNWHIDLGQGEASTRKISISICLNEDFVGGELLFFSDELYKLKLPLGKCIAFPSFLSHKVLPVRQGVRWALVAWISGEPFR
jgi:predicted 2-oxoglutarate/Fe(II)-dependent dioxygenase YbiX